MKQRFYFDTSVFGGVFDEEFEETTLQLFERVKLGKVICIYSNLIENELLKAPKNVKQHFKSLPNENLEYHTVDDEAVILAKKYIDENVVGKTSFNDCIHIAIATIHKADILVSWNFKHIVNVYRIRGYNSVNLKRLHTIRNSFAKRNSGNMKNKINERVKTFDSVKSFRVIKEEISEEIYEMDLKQIKEHLNKKSIEFRNEMRIMDKDK